MTLMPLFKEAGIQARTTLKFMKLNELEGMYDQLQLAEDRQREYFEEMISSNKYIPPELFQDHQNMIAYALQYFMTVEFKYLEPDLKHLCQQHIIDRSRLPAQEAQLLAGGAPAPGGEQPSPGPVPGGGAPPAPPAPSGPGVPAPQPMTAEAAPPMSAVTAPGAQ